MKSLVHVRNAAMLMMNGFLSSYTLWIFRVVGSSSSVSSNNNKGESDTSDGDNMQEMLCDAFGIPSQSFDQS